MITRRTFAQGLVASSIGVAHSARADDAYPNRPIRLVVGLAPGGIADSRSLREMPASTSGRAASIWAKTLSMVSP